jgi:hypothetical protein
MIKSWRLRWVGHVARMGEKWSAYRKDIGGKARRKETARKIKM